MVASALYILICGHFTEEVTISPCFIAKEREALRGEVLGWTWTSLLVGWVICHFGHYLFVAFSERVHRFS